MHRHMRDLFVQTLTLSTLGIIFSKRHFDFFFLILRREQDLHFMQFAAIAWNVKFCFLGNEKKKYNEFNLSSAELAQRAHFKDFPTDARFIQCVSFTR